MHFQFVSLLKSFVGQDWCQELHSCDPNASLDTNMDDLGSTMKCMATMATFIIWSLWQYCHSGHRDNRLCQTINMIVDGSVLTLGM